MPKWLRIIVGLSITAVIFLAVLGFIFYNMLTAPLPEYSGVISSGKIINNVEIYRDSMAIPYIIARNEKDAAFALGYVHAQERMFTMDLTRRAGEGRLSEILGSKLVPFDMMFLTVGIKKFAHDNYNKLDPEVKTILESYSEGINLYLNNHKGKLPVEFDILGYEPYEWKPEHSLIVIRLIGWELNIAWWIDYTYAYLIQKIGEEKAREIIPDYNYAAPHSIPVALKDLPVDLNFVKTDRLFRQISGFRGTQLGSNNWVVGDSASASGKPIIANDPHLAYSAPGRWMAAVIRGGKWNTEGVTLPGVPGVVIGKNENISWVLTNLMADDTDFYIEQIDSSGNNYMLDGKWVKFTTRKVKIPVKDSLDVEYIIKYTHRGPVVSNIHPYDILYQNPGIKKQVISMRWSGSEFSDEMLAFYKINLASNWDEFRDALKTFALPGQNFVYADKYSNIGYVMGSKIPLRDGVNPLLIYDGTKSSSDWKGYLPYESQPVLFNPPSNFFATANNKVVKNFSHYITNLWEPESRVQRIYELLRSKDRHSADDFMNYQMDITSPYAKELTSYLLAAFSGFKISNENMNRSFELMQKWDYSFSHLSQTPSIYAVFLDRLLKNIYMDDLGRDLYNEFVFIGNIPYRSLMKVLADSSASVIDDVNTEKVETRNEIIRKSFADAVADLEKNYGDDMRFWQWGDLHKVEFKHAFGGVSGLVDNVVNIGPFPVGGDGTTIFNTEYPFNEGIKEFPRFDHDRFENDLGATMRYIYDFSRPDEFYLILTGGQSGHILSDHYKDMSDLWLKGKYMRIKTDLTSIRRNSDRLIQINKQ
jgi:penicillin G amidase